LHNVYRQREREMGKVEGSLHSELIWFDFWSNVCFSRFMPLGP
jgi:hypothetical protein